MKKLIFAACGAVALTACNKTALLEEARPVPTKAATETAATVTVRDGKLCFADEAAIEKTLSMLLGKDESGFGCVVRLLGIRFAGDGPRSRSGRVPVDELVGRIPRFQGEIPGPIPFQ